MGPLTVPWFEHPQAVELMRKLLETLVLFSPCNSLIRPKVQTSDQHSESISQSWSIKSTPALARKVYEEIPPTCIRREKEEGKPTMQVLHTNANLLISTAHGRGERQQSRAEQCNLETRKAACRALVRACVRARTRV